MHKISHNYAEVILEHVMSMPDYRDSRMPELKDKLADLKLLQYGDRNAGVLSDVTKALCDDCQCALSTANLASNLRIYAQSMRYDVIVCADPQTMLTSLHQLLRTHGIVIFRYPGMDKRHAMTMANVAQLKLVSCDATYEGYICIATRF